MRSWGAEEGLLGAFQVGPGDWLGAREDSQGLLAPRVSGALKAFSRPISACSQA